MFKAYCYRTGEIGFTAGFLPSGALPIVAGIERQVRAEISVTARHGYKAGVLLVPGVPEAEDDDSALEALFAYCDWLAERNKTKPMLFGNAAA